ncbi:hypothetical protein K440DRAFT_28068 [Wilcoxina mikolae CBS 423.85]|nr:hypothetical protein K440DRAFT_28068 [Wilcoxina mikolae CBS 423.85]
MRLMHASPSPRVDSLFTSSVVQTSSSSSSFTSNTITSWPPPKNLPPSTSTSTKRVPGAPTPSPSSVFGGSRYLLLLILLPPQLTPSWDFQQIADELLQECVQSESTPAPGGWDVLDYSGSILTRRFWEDLAVPGGKYFLAPGASVTPSRPAPQPQQQQQEPEVPQVNSTPSYYPESLPPPRNYSDPLNPQTYTPPTPAPPKPRTYPSPTPPPRTYTSPTPAPRTDEALFNPPTPPKSWAQIATTTTSTPSPPSSTSIPTAPALSTIWTPAPTGKRAGLAIKITVRDADCKVVHVLNLPRNDTIGQLVERLGGRQGSKIQVLNRVQGGFAPGATYMVGTRKTMAEVGWGGSVNVWFFQGEKGEGRVEGNQGNQANSRWEEGISQWGTERKWDGTQGKTWATVGK